MNDIGGLKEFTEALRADEALQDQAAACETAEELVVLAGEQGYKITVEEVKEAAGEEQ